MLGPISLDRQVKHRLNQWPQRPPGLLIPFSPEHWLRGRPTDDIAACLPFLKLPGSDRMKTVPDGLWLNFGGTPGDKFVEIFVVEACGSVSNFRDKRARYAPSTHSLLAACPQSWLLAPVSLNDRTPRWQATGLLQSPPTAAQSFPVRDIRVLYALPRPEYDEFEHQGLAHGHEMFVPVEVLAAPGSHKDEAVRTLISRLSFSAHFLRAA